MHGECGERWVPQGVEGVAHREHGKVALGTDRAADLWKGYIIKSGV